MPDSRVRGARPDWECADVTSNTRSGQYPRGAYHCRAPGPVQTSCSGSCGDGYTCHNKKRVFWSRMHILLVVLTALSIQAKSVPARTITIGVDDSMKYTVTAITAKPGETLRVVIKST